MQADQELRNLIYVLFGCGAVTLLVLFFLAMRYKLRVASSTSSKGLAEPLINGQDDLENGKEPVLYVKSASLKLAEKLKLDLKAVKEQADKETASAKAEVEAVKAALKEALEKAELASREASDVKSREQEANEAHEAALKQALEKADAAAAKGKFLEALYQEVELAKAAEISATSELAKVSEELKCAKAEVAETQKRLRELEGHVEKSPKMSARITDMRDQLKSSKDRYDKALELEQDKQQKLAQARSQIYKVDRQATPVSRRMSSVPKVISYPSNSVPPPVIIKSGVRSVTPPSASNLQPSYASKPRKASQKTLDTFERAMGA